MWRLNEVSLAMGLALSSSSTAERPVHTGSADHVAITDRAQPYKHAVILSSTSHGVLQADGSVPFAADLQYCKKKHWEVTNQGEYLGNTDHSRNS